MTTKILKTDPDSVNTEILQEAGDLIASGKLVAFPTETVYGLGANATNDEACYNIFEAKGRPHDNPLIVHVLHPSDCSQYADTEKYPLFQKLADRFMPGPLTIILPKKKTIPDSVTVGLDTVALRCPSHPVARALLAASNCPIAAPSANLSGKPSPTTAAHVIEDMTGRVDMIIDGGECEVGLESTVISIRENEIHLLRPGFVTAEDLSRVCENVIIAPSVLSVLGENEKPESPGMKYRHYAPLSPVSAVKGSDEKVLSFFAEEVKKGNGILCFDEDLEALKNMNVDLTHVIAFGSRDDLVSQANNLFDALRSFDKTNVPRIFARFTSQEQLGLAISNRLLRACAFNIITL